MKKNEIIIREFALKGKKIVSSSELSGVCDKYGFDFRKTKVALLNRGYLLTIFRGIYYLKDYNEKKTGVIAYSVNELLSLGLREKGVKWYFGLNTALKMLNLTHEVFPVAYVLNDRFNRVKPMEIAGSRFMFRKIKPPLCSFGIDEVKTANGVVIRRSDPEKTLLDMVYLHPPAGRPLIEEYKDTLRKKRMGAYAKKYPKTVREVVKEALK